MCIESNRVNRLKNIANSRQAVGTAHASKGLKHRLTCICMCWACML
jgi:hypothetical protein